MRSDAAVPGKVAGSSPLVPTDVAVLAANLSKAYRIYDHPRDRLRQLFSIGGRRYFHEFWALRDVDFTVRRGEALGIIGRNGQGKSTLLQLLAGTLKPTQGRVDINGRVAALLELPAGTPVVHLERLRLADGEPLAVLNNYLPQETAPTREELERLGLYEALRARGIRPAVARQRVSVG